MTLEEVRQGQGFERLLEQKFAGPTGLKCGNSSNILKEKI